MELGSPISDVELGTAGGSKAAIVNHHVDFSHANAGSGRDGYDAVELSPDPSENRDVKAIRRGSFSKLEEELGNTEDPLSKKDAKDDLHLGTFRGVILPCLQSNMLGAILFIRLPWIVAEVGILQATVIVFLSVISVLLTSTSLSAIVTNGKLSKTGSLYYVLRKNIGLELGGSVGVMYTCGKLLACAMYCLGAAEAFMLAIGQHGSFHWDTTTIAIAIATFLCFSTAVQRSNMLFDRVSNILLAIAGLGFLSFVVGGCAFAARDYYGDAHMQDRVDMNNIGSDPVNESRIDGAVNFYFLLGLYYPSVSGIMGASTWSGSLENPGRSIPKGTMLATLITFLVSIIIIYLFGYTVSNAELLENKLILASLAWPVSGLGYVCIVCALWGAASQSLHGVIRSISAIAADGAVPFFRYFNEPRVDAERLKARQVFFAWVLISIACLAKHLDHIAYITAIFYLVVYAALNAACFLHSVTKSPGFRPHFKYFSWHTALAGMLWCLVLMFVINFWITLIVLFALTVLSAYIVQSAAFTEWGDAFSGLMFNMIRDILMYLTRSVDSHRAKNWRPQILIITRLKERSSYDNGKLYDVKVEHENLIRFAGQLKKGKGLTLVTGLIQGDSTSVDHSVVSKSQKMIDNFMLKEQVDGFTRIGVVADMQVAFESTIQMSGIGAMSPNTFLCEWPSNWERLSESSKKSHVDRFKTVIAAKKAIMVVKGAAKLPDNLARLAGFVDVWWLVHDGGLILLIPYLLSLHKVWRGCTIRVFVVVTRADDNPNELKRRAETHLERVRIRAIVETVDLSIIEREGGDLYEKTLDRANRMSLLQKLEDYNERRAAYTNILEGKSDWKADASRKPVEASPRGAGSEGLMALFNAGGKDSSISRGGEEARKSFGRTRTHQDLEEAERLAALNKKKQEVQSLANRAAVAAAATAESGEPVDAPIKLNKAKTTLAPPISEKNTVEAIRHDSMVKSQVYGVDQGRMQVAIHFNRLLREKSKKSKLVVTNLPILGRMKPEETIVYINTFTQDIDPVLLVRGSGEEVISTYG